MDGGVGGFEVMYVGMAAGVAFLACCLLPEAPEPRAR